jgi:hypothetical protein
MAIDMFQVVLLASRAGDGETVFKPDAETAKGENAACRKKV